MKKKLIVCGVVLGVLLAAGLAAFFAPLPIPYYQDFSVMYFTARARLSGIPIYAYTEQLPFVKALTPQGFEFHPYPYPPWFALATLFIGLLPIQAGARTWFLLNAAMICASVWFLTPRWKFIPRILGILAALLFIPAFGLLVVGQYSAPVLLGTALFVFAARHKSAIPTAIGLLLLTFKPHIGGFLFLAGVTYLFLAEPAFGRRALWLTFGGGIFLAAIGFLADGAWPLTYFQSLIRYTTINGVQSCGLCVSLPVVLIRVFSGQSSMQAASWVSLGLGLLMGLLIYWRLRFHLKDPAVLMSIVAVATLLIDPYLLNYDYILLLVPFFWLVGRTKFILPVYFLPWAALIFRSYGDVIFASAGIVTFILILRISHTPVIAQD